MTRNPHIPIGIAILAGALLAGCGPGAPTAPAPSRSAGEAAYVGARACAPCHPGETALWRESDHARAMEAADGTTVLGDFDGATFDHFGDLTTFSRRDRRFFVRTGRADGAPREYEIAYTFGADPLQQYLVPFPGGRYQALGVAWDARPRESGGQRWFHLYPHERIAPGDPLHWTGLFQNWNLMCAECHSTNLRKGYRADGDRFETTWSEINVACEACHGPGSRHVAWAGGAADPDLGLVVRLRDRDLGAWTMDPGRGSVRRVAPPPARTEVETCGRCHARRSVIEEDYVHGRPLADTHRPALIEPPLYHADGQILDEVYEYGSFLQSRMHGAGVTCSDCHDPHSSRVTPSGNAVCARCHLPAKYDVESHHHHAAGTAGARCVSCHMAVRTYMVVDPRRDHSFRVPRPDLSVRIGTPDACTDCHVGRGAAWAAAAIERWHGKGPRPRHWGETLHAAREALAGAGTALAALASDPEAPGIVRATAVAALSHHLGPSVMPVLERAARDADPLVRMAAASVLDGLPVAERLRLAGALLSDAVRAVRIEAAQALAAIPSGDLTADRRSAQAAALAEYRRAQVINADRPEAHLNLALLADLLGDPQEAEREYRRALDLSPGFAPAYVNLADHLGGRGRDAEGERLLRDGIARIPDDAGLHHALGLVLVRLGRHDEALAALARAAWLAPEVGRYAYVHAVGLNSVGRGSEAIAILRRAQGRHTGDRDLLAALATIHRDRGHRAAALLWARRLVASAPDDPDARSLVRELEGEGLRPGG